MGKPNKLLIESGNKEISPILQIPKRQYQHNALTSNHLINIIKKLPAPYLLIIHLILRFHFLETKTLQNNNFIIIEKLHYSKISTGVYKQHDM